MESVFVRLHGILYLTEKFEENLARSRGFKEIEMIARMSALDFYKKLDYKTEGDEFEEVTVRSINMIKIF